MRNFHHLTSLRCFENAHNGSIFKASLLNKRITYPSSSLIFLRFLFPSTVHSSTLFSFLILVRTVSQYVSCPGSGHSESRICEPFLVVSMSTLEVFNLLILALVTLILAFLLCFLEAAFAGLTSVLILVFPPTLVNLEGKGTITVFLLHMLTFLNFVENVFFKTFLAVATVSGVSEWLAI